MRQDDRFTVINIREFLRENDDGEEQFGEDDLYRALILYTIFVTDNHRT